MAADEGTQMVAETQRVQKLASPYRPQAGRRRWTSAEDATLRQLRAQGWARWAMAERLDRTAIAVRGRLVALGLTNRKAPRWTPAEELRLIDLLEDHRTYRQIGRALGRTVVAVVLKCRRIGCRFTKTNGRTVNATARLMDVDAHAVKRWIREGWLTAHRTDMRMHSGNVWMVEDDDLVEFLEQSEHWHVWQPERIRDYALREWATELRAGVRLLTVGEAAQRMCVTINCVNQMIHDGRIPAVRWGNWRIREEDAVYPEPPSKKGRPKPPRWTEQERTILADWWGKRPIGWIAEQLGRPEKAVYQAGYRLGLPYLRTLTSGEASK